MQAYINEEYKTQVVLSNSGNIINISVTGYPCHFWWDEKVKIVQLENAVIIDGIEFKKWSK